MKTLKTYNPTTGDLLKELNVTKPDEIKQIVFRSQKAQELWAARPIEERVNLILKAYDEIIERSQEFAELIHAEMGKTLKEAQGEVAAYTGNIKNMGEEVISALKPTKNSDEKTRTTTYHDPLGVCASITPWNFPLGMPHTLMMPSLMAGNTVVFKPSEEVPLIGLKYAEILNKHLPQDVLQVVIGGGEQGAQLVKEDVQLITFTGSQNTGKKILEAAGSGLKRVLLELGGKDPLIVLKNADLEAAAEFAANNSFRNAGQVCVSTEQIFVEDEVYDEFLNKLKSKVSDIKIGSMIHSRQKQHVLDQIKEAVGQGAKVIYGNPQASEGNYVEPTILTDVTPNMKIMQDETFGPIACIAKVKTGDEAVQWANSTNYALGGVVFGQPDEVTNRLARKLKSGMVGINRGVGGAKGSPWVGAGQSGYGFHGSPEGHRQFTQTRIVSEPI